jgi:hypothetical protein
VDLGKPRTRGSEEVAGNAGSFVLAVFAASRLFCLISGALLVRLVPIDAWQRQSSDVPFGTLSIWAHMDGDHYLSIAEGGYSEGSPAFFPLYPLLIRLSAALFGGPISRGGLSVYGVLISLAAFYFALYFVYRIAEEGWGTNAARGTVLALAFFPTSFFFNAVYTESLFLALSAGAVWSVRVRKDLLLACLLAGLATATRNVGVFLIVPLLWEGWRNRREYSWRIVYLAFAPAGVAAYMAYLWWYFGDPLRFYGAQSDWGRESPGSTNALVGAFRLAYENLQALLDPAKYSPFSFQRLVYVVSGTNYLYNLLFLLLALALLIAGWRVLPSDFKIYTFALLSVPILFAPADNPLMSTPRFVLVAFPLFIVLGMLLKDRRLLAGWLLLSVVASVMFIALFVGWFFVA